MHSHGSPFEFTICADNEYLLRDVRAFYHADYTGYQTPNNPDYINTLKNTFNNTPRNDLQTASQELRHVLSHDLAIIAKALNSRSIAACVVPRAKSIYTTNQLMFKLTVKDTLKKLDRYIDGTNFITRHTNTRTTHLRKDIPGYNNDGSSPYPGITKDTCHISPAVQGKHILLIDDIYTWHVIIIEDALQALTDSGAESVSFYSIGKTKNMLEPSR